MTEKLKPCPFCGGDAYCGENRYLKDKYIVCCGKFGEGCIHPSSGSVEKNKLEQTIQSWNKRVND